MSPSRFPIPDGVSDGAIREKNTFRSHCSDLFTARPAEAGGQREDILEGNAQGSTSVRRIEYSFSGKLQAHIEQPKELAECCRKTPNACARRYVDSVLKGELFDRTQASGQSARRETIRETGGEKYFAFTTSRLVLADDRPVELSLKKAADGTLCMGETTSLKLEVSRRLYVQLWSISGTNCSGEAILIYPSDPGETGFIDPASPLTLDGLQAIPTPGAQSECLIAIAAESREALGNLSDFRGCRLGKARAAKLLDTGVLSHPDRHLFIARDQYTLSDSESCTKRGIPAPADAKQSQSEAAQQIASIPLCR